MRQSRNLGWLALFACGCLSPTGKLGFLPDGQHLTKDASQIRAQTPPPADIARELAKQAADPYVVEPGDVLLIQASGLDSPVRLPGDQPVLPDGTVHLGRFGRLQVAGKAIEDVERDAAALIRTSEKEVSRITARVVTRESKVFYVIGEVNAPGSFPLRGRETVLDALLAAGGLNSNASRRGIILTRPTTPDSCRIVLPVRISDIVQLGDTTTNYQIRAGDRIFVPSRDLWDDLCKLLPWHKKEECWSKPQSACPPGAASLPAAVLASPSPITRAAPTALPARMELPRPRAQPAAAPTPPPEPLAAPVLTPVIPAPPLAPASHASGP
jgi:protein involved in polysaccharide export with SLBB domain